MFKPEFTVEYIRDGIRPIREAAADLPDSSRYYFDFYGLDPEKDMPGVEHLFGSFESEGYQIAAHVYRPAEYSATVVLVHGYLGHCGQFRNAIPFLLKKGYAVCAYDKPGHGLSSGDPAWIDDFEKYAGVMDDFKKVAADICHGPYHVIAFSHGGCAVMQRRLEGKEDFFDKTILIAPLVRPVHWKKARASYRFYMLYKKDVDRYAYKSTFEHLDDFKKKDFLSPERLPLMWVRALVKWNRHVAGLPPCGEKILVIQGDKDSTVDWKYNTKFLDEKFDAKIVMIENGKHELFEDTDGIRNKVFGELGNYLK